MDFIEITEEPLKVDEISAQVTDKCTGATSLFVGTTRKMKIKRQKKVGRILSFFKNNYGHRPPFQLLIDGTFTQACLQMKVNIKDQLPKYLGEVKLLTTKCCIQECEKLGPSIFGATVILKQFGIHKCTHEEDTKPAMKCLK
jgi:U3 small nucleolar RNA-associated protein 23